MVDFEYKDSYGVCDLEKLIALLRSERGCPWDREQTHQSIRRNFLEETYEACEAIDAEDPKGLCEELGDVLTQVVFHARIEEEAGGFNLDSVADGVCKKLIHRHPHVFGDIKADGADEVLANWDTLKRKEKQQETTTDAMEAVAKSLPATWRAEKIQSKAKKVGYDFPDVVGALDKLSEELSELREAISRGTNVEEELGDVLFSAVNVARIQGIDPEGALHKSADKFTARFRYMENATLAADKQLEDMSLEEMDALYVQGKSRL